jgi:hypothetical protein
MDDNKELVEIAAKGTVKGILESLPATQKQIDITFSNIVYKINRILNFRNIESNNIENAIYEYADKIQNIEEGELLEIPQNIGVKIIEELKLVDSKIVRSLYTELLKKLSVKSECDTVHPQLLKIIPYMTENDIKFVFDLSYVEDNSFAYIEFIEINSKNEYYQAGFFSAYPKSFDSETLLLTISALLNLGVIEKRENKLFKLSQKCEAFLEDNFQIVRGSYGQDNARYKFKKDSTFKEEIKKSLMDDHEAVTVYLHQFSLTFIGLYLKDFINENDIQIIKA